MIDAVLRLAHLLRREGMDVSCSEVIDALGALRHVRLGVRGEVRETLRACLVKQAGREAFDRCFDTCFAGRRAGVADAASPGRAPVTGSGSSGPPAGTGPAMAAAITGAMLAGDDQELDRLATQAVGMFAGLDDPSRSERYLMHRVLRTIDISRMLSGAMQRLRAEGQLTELELVLQRTELAARLDGFRRRLADEIARRLAELGVDAHGGPAGIGESIERTRPDDLDLMELSRAEHDAIRRALPPLIRRLATRISHRRRQLRAGRVDLRRTVRRSLQTGGVPVEVATRRARPHRPELVVLCDVSGSVAEFAQFAFTLINALHDEVRDVRSFAFVDGVAEVTDLFTNATHQVAVSRLVERRGVVGLDGHSDYGAVFTQLAAEPLSSVVGPRTSLVVCGDARGNYRPGHPDAFYAVARRARRVYWLNPEPRSRWGTEDSLMEEYEPWCTTVHEVRTLAQFEQAITRML